MPGAKTLLDEILQTFGALSEPDQNKLLDHANKIVDGRRWNPNPGPQTEAFFCPADELFYGGEAGGGKTDLIVGLSLTDHQKSLVLRRTNVEAAKLIQRFTEILGSRVGFNGQDNVWRIDNKIIDIGGVQHEDDKQKRKGDPHDFIGFDEIADFTETQFRFIIGWNRSTNKLQRCRVVCTGNPPTTPEGFWIVRYWGAWLDKSHPRPAKPGELRWYTSIEGEDVECEGPEPVMVENELVVPRSRTFIPSGLEDNPDLFETNYRSVLAALPEPLRSAYMKGKFVSAQADQAWQVIPTRWVELAQARWSPDGNRARMSALAVDVAQGGLDNTVLQARHGGWFAMPDVHRGIDTTNGPAVAGLIVVRMRDRCVIIIDMGGGYGQSAYDHLTGQDIPMVVAYNGSNEGMGRSRDGTLKFRNRRAQVYWRFREALDPDYGSALALPPDDFLRLELCAVHWKMTPTGIQIEDKAEVKKRIGRSPDRADAAVMAWAEGEQSTESARGGSDEMGRAATRYPATANMGTRRRFH